MNSISNTIDVGNDCGRSVSIRATNDFRRLLTVGVGLPTLLALANRFVLAHVIHAASSVMVALVMGFYVLQIGTISWLVGTYIRNGVLRWFMFGWIMILIDLQLAVLTSSNFESGVRCLAAAILAGQLGVIIVWGVLGRVPWFWRLPFLLVILKTCISLYSLLKVVNARPTYYGSWSDISVVQGVLLTLLAGMLRLSGYSLARATLDPASADKTRFRSAHQFGIRDVLIWTASLAVILAVARAGNLLNVEFAKRFYGAKMLFVFTTAICTTAIMIAAIWAALGEGSVWLRSIGLVLLSTCIGTPIGFYSAYVVQQRPGWWAHSIWFHAQYWWIGWMILTGLLLAASLLIFRAQGYRLMKHVAPNVVR
jgi:hypothetical protein